MNHDLQVDVKKRTDPVYNGPCHICGALADKIHSGYCQRGHHFAIPVKLIRRSLAETLRQIDREFQKAFWGEVMSDTKTRHQVCKILDTHVQVTESTKTSLLDEIMGIIKLCMEKTLEGHPADLIDDKINEVLGVSPYCVPDSDPRPNEGPASELHKMLEEKRWHVMRNCPLAIQAAALCKNHGDDSEATIDRAAMCFLAEDNERIMKLLFDMECMKPFSAVIPPPGGRPTKQEYREEPASAPPANEKLPKDQYRCECGHEGKTTDFELRPHDPDYEWKCPKCGRDIVVGFLLDREPASVPPANETIPKITNQIVLDLLKDLSTDRSFRVYVDDRYQERLERCIKHYEEPSSQPPGTDMGNNVYVASAEEVEHMKRVDEALYGNEREGEPFKIDVPERRDRHGNPYPDECEFSPEGEAGDGYELIESTGVLGPDDQSIMDICRSGKKPEWVWHPSDRRKVGQDKDSQQTYRRRIFGPNDPPHVDVYSPEQVAELLVGGYTKEELDTIEEYLYGSPRTGPSLKSWGICSNCGEVMARCKCPSGG